MFEEEAMKEGISFSGGEGLPANIMLSMEKNNYGDHNEMIKPSTAVMMDFVAKIREWIKSSKEENKSPEVGKLKEIETKLCEDQGAVQKIADPNLREVNAIFIQHEEIGVVSREEKEVKFTPIRDENPTLTKRVRGKKNEKYDSNQCIDISLFPYPHRFLQLQAKFQKKKVLGDLKNLHTNIDSADLGEVKFQGGTRRNLPQKLLDPGEFVVPCEIGGQLGEKAICDSGASVNIMPSSLHEKLGLSGIKPTEVILQLADKSVKVPLGCVEDVELKIDKLRLSADFVVLDVENSKNVPIILGRPFLATAGTIIDLKQRKLTMDIEGQRVEIKASKISHDPP
ncbi:uncharacterized protein LOC142519648 [Primulina tabacum]|uniref:uncharacterized protein LOC142519648 n=1 Tax=Primulina tabacum TaxID=48773 RepID=UPI003F5A814E